MPPLRRRAGRNSGLTKRSNSHPPQWTGCRIRTSDSQACGGHRARPRLPPAPVRVRGSLLLHEPALRARLKSREGPVFAGKAGWRGATKEHTLQGSVTEEQRSQPAFPAKTLRATGLLREAFVGSTVTARCGDAPVSPPRPRTKSLVAGPFLLFSRALTPTLSHRVRVFTHILHRWRPGQGVIVGHRSVERRTVPEGPGTIESGARPADAGSAAPGGVGHPIRRAPAGRGQQPVRWGTIARPCHTPVGVQHPMGEGVPRMRDG